MAERPTLVDGPSVEVIRSEESLVVERAVREADLAREVVTAQSRTTTPAAGPADTTPRAPARGLPHRPARPAEDIP